MALADYINSKPTIETDRLIIRPMIAADVPALKEWMPDKSIYTYWGKGPSKAEKNPELLFEKEDKPTKSFHLGIAQKDSNEEMEREGQFLAQKTASDNEIEIVAFVDGKVAGTAGIDAVSTKYKVRHRPGFDGGVH